MQKISNFSRTRDNLAKLGQYFTNLDHTKALSGLFQWPEGEVSILEPSIGDASALKSFLDRKENRTIFGVELDTRLYESLKETKEVDYLLNSDFISGVAISHSSFSLCFANPPYGEGEYGERLESVFMKKTCTYLKTDGVIVLIIPYYLFNKDENFAEKFTSRFDVEATYKFHEEEFKKYRQIVLIGRKKEEPERDIIAEEKLTQLVEDIENLTLLPFNYDGDRIEIHTSSSQNIKHFQTLSLDVDELSNSYKKGSLLSKINILKKVKEERQLFPPITPKTGHLYLLGTTGFTSGMIGTKEDRDLHLQRGKVKEETRIEHEDMKSGAVKERIKTFKTTSMVLIESSGLITRY